MARKKRRVETELIRIEKDIDQEQAELIEVEDENDELMEIEDLNTEDK
ncbi:hypothetical protein OHJ21_25375 [Virgibacillus sp. LDC1]|nr:hypothetical protein [Virgibacillus sp. LDC1]